MDGLGAAFRQEGQVWKPQEKGCSHVKVTGTMQSDEHGLSGSLGGTTEARQKRAMPSSDCENSFRNKTALGEWRISEPVRSGIGLPKAGGRGIQLSETSFGNGRGALEALRESGWQGRTLFAYTTGRQGRTPGLSPIFLR